MRADARGSTYLLPPAAATASAPSPLVVSTTEVAEEMDLRARRCFRQQRLPVGSATHMPFSLRDLQFGSLMRCRGGGRNDEQGGGGYVQRRRNRLTRKTWRGGRRTLVHDCTSPSARRSK